jgi:hypothetical protein
MFTNFATGAQPINHQPNEMANYGQTNNAFQPQLQAQPQPHVKPQLQAQPQIVSDEEKKLDLQSPFAKVKSDFAFNSKANKTETDNIDMTSASNGFTKLPTDFEGAREYAKYISSSQLVPAAMRSTPDCDRSADTFLIIQKGNRLGLLPADALQMIYILSGRTSMSVKAKAGICRKYGTWSITFDGQNARASVEGYRFDRPNQKESFTYTGTDAAIAGKMEKDTNGVWVGTQATWKTMWPDMLRARALSHFLDQVFPDVVGGFVDETYDLDVENDTKTATDNKEKAEQLIKKARSKKSTVQTASKEMPSLVIKHEEPKVTAVQDPDTVAPKGDSPF